MSIWCPTESQDSTSTIIQIEIRIIQYIMRFFWKMAKEEQINIEKTGVDKVLEVS